MAAIALSTTTTHFLQPAWREDTVSALWSFSLCAFVGTVCLATSDAACHWFMIPVAICGGLIGIDAIDWIRGRVDVFDPIGVLGVIGVHFYFAAPMLNVVTNSWIRYIEPPDDWRPWLHVMAWFNVVGLLLYRFVRRFVTKAWSPVPTRKVWRLQPQRFAVACAAALAVATVVQTSVYLQFGGIGGYVEAFTESIDNFAGFGHLFIIADSFPIITVIGAVAWARSRPGRRTWPVAMAILFGFVAFTIYFGGLRGSRGHLIYGLFWAVGIVHYLLWPVPKKVLAAGVLAVLAFMYAYGFYKSFGANALEAIEDSGNIEELGAQSNRGIMTLILGDLARADIQAFILYRMSPECITSNFRCFYGETYLAAATIPIPRSILPLRPLDRTFAGTEALYGRSMNISRQAITLAVFGTGWDYISTYSYGVAGEAMLNFGPIGVPLSFIPLAVVAVWARRWRARLSSDDIRHYLAPFVFTLPFMVLLWDSDILVFYTIKNTLVSVMVLYCGSTREARRSPALEGVVA